jgi:hypothetical protein
LDPPAGPAPRELLSSVSFLLSPFLPFEGDQSTFAFEKLLVYQKPVDFADQVCKRTEWFARGYGFLVDQLNRASLWWWCAFDGKAG